MDKIIRSPRTPISEFWNVRRVNMIFTAVCGPVSLEAALSFVSMHTTIGKLKE